MYRYLSVSTHFIVSSTSLFLTPFKVWWSYATLFVFIYLYTIDTFIHHSFINIRWGLSPYLHSCRLSGWILHGVPSRDLNSGLTASQRATNWATLHPFLFPLSSGVGLGEPPTQPRGGRGQPPPHGNWERGHAIPFSGNTYEVHPKSNWKMWIKREWLQLGS